MGSRAGARCRAVASQGGERESRRVNRFQYRRRNTLIGGRLTRSPGTSILPVYRIEWLASAERSALPYVSRVVVCSLIRDRENIVMEAVGLEMKMLVKRMVLAEEAVMESDEGERCSALGDAGIR